MKKNCPHCNSNDLALNDGTVQCQDCGAWWYPKSEKQITIERRQERKAKEQALRDACEE